MLQSLNQIIPLWHLLRNLFKSLLTIDGNNGKAGRQFSNHGCSVRWLYAWKIWSLGTLKPTALMMNILTTLAKTGRRNRCWNSGVILSSRQLRSLGQCSDYLTPPYPEALGWGEVLLSAFWGRVGCSCGTQARNIKIDQSKTYFINYYCTCLLLSY